MEGLPADFSPTLSCTGLLPASATHFVLELAYDSQDRTFTWQLVRSLAQVYTLQETLRKQLLHTAKAPVTPLSASATLTALAPADQQRALESYLLGLVARPDTLHSEPVLEFLEVSARSFDGTSSKRKEGYVLKRTGGRIGNEARVCNCSRYFRRFQQRWLLLRDSSISYLMKRCDRVLQEALSFKGQFRVLAGREDTGYEDGIRVQASQRELLFRAGSIGEMREWQSAITQAYSQSLWSEAANPYQSSFPVRKDCLVQFYVDGENYFRSLYECLIHAQREVFVADFWLSPEMYLLRPPEQHPESQIVEVLGRLADQGIRVRVSLYKEVKFTLDLNSLHTKRTLKQRSPRIRVLRHPCRSVTGGELLWAHHEKVVCIDQEVAFLGGFDMAYGRWDTSQHVLFEHSGQTWPGIDYYNCYVHDFEGVQRYARDTIDRLQTPRMPWHDVGVKATGAVAADVSLHFIELWNHIMTDVTTAYRRRKSLLQPSIRLENIEVEPCDESPTYQQVRQMMTHPTKHTSRDSIIKRSEASLSDIEEVEALKDSGLVLQNLREQRKGTQQGQVVRSVGPWSMGLAPEASVHLAYLHLIDQADHFIYIENQFFISSTGGDIVANQVAQALVERIKVAAAHKEAFKVIVVLPLLPGFQGTIDDPAAALLRLELYWEQQTICKGPNSLLAQLRTDANIPDPHQYIQFYGLRTHALSPCGVPCTELVYVHSKLMITDDDTAIVGSANVNDRSMLGTRDSEIATVIRDEKKVESQLAGHSVQVSASVLELRLKLFQEFSGCTDISQLRDPLNPLFATVWDQVAQRNTEFYRRTFACCPDDTYQKVSDLPRERPESTAYDPTQVVGFLVEWPLQFMEREDLRVSVFTKEYFAPDENFT